MSAPGSIPRAMLVRQSVAGLMSEHGRARLRELVFGEGFRELRREDGWSFGEAERDSYPGWIRCEHLGETGRQTPTHRVRVARSYAFGQPDLKAPDEPLLLSFGARVEVFNTHEDKSGVRWAEIADFREYDPELDTKPGCYYVPAPHLAPLDEPETDPAAVAELLIGTPYLWGGNSAYGVDCSGLVQMALLACGIPCPGDSDQQEALGAPATGAQQRGDLIFWEGHVAMALDETRMIHANAHHMEVAIEPTAEAEARILAKGSGPVIARRRL
ncbi:NlpC/P60 family protein [Pseudoroseicyclus sp. CXY001]|uniref:C40 family peptidase n=1 Tax=Pseudoroseicyclus sp. CXY001 TaxID=3242492 RepID=UPI003570A169